MVKIPFWAISFILLYVFGGYLFLLMVLSRIKRNTSSYDHYHPQVTIVLTVHNEELLLERRVKNILESKYPPDLLEVLIASDNSTDRTDEIVKNMSAQDARIKIVRTKAGGKSAAQNEAIPHAKGEIIILTDAETMFEKRTIRNLVKEFANQRVGCVDGKCIFERNDGSIADNKGIYFKYEYLIRKLESRAGILFTASGMVMAFRKDLFRRFDYKYGDDCAIPLDILEQGYKVVHAEDAIAYDVFPFSMRGEFRARVRMTLRNITCTLSKPNLLNPFKHPLLLVAILSHKVFRWLTPYFLIAFFVFNLFLLDASVFYRLAFAGQLMFYATGIVGFAAHGLKLSVPLASQVFSFLLANAGLFVGVLKAALAKEVTCYKY